MMSQKSEKFRGFVADVKRIIQQKWPDKEIREFDDMMFVGDIPVDFESFFRCVSLSSEDQHTAMTEYLDKLMNQDLNAPAVIPKVLALKMVMPLIKSDAIFRRLDERTVAHSRYMMDTIVVLVLDLPQTTVSLQNGHVANWRLQHDDLHEIALENLAKRSDAEPTWLGDEWKSDSVMAWFNCNDGYDASRLLLPDLHRRLAWRLGESFVVAIPSRDCFLAVPESMADSLREKAIELFESKPYPITSKLFMVVQDGVLPL
jgi:uncharacterized protein YtpQ (UPF0354 family)